MLELIKDKNGTLSDYITEANEMYEELSFSLDVEKDTGYLYIGANFPFNHVYFNLNVVNATASVMSLETWNGKSWVDVSRLIDGTILAGATLGKDGYIEWVPDKNEPWSREDTVGSSGTETITGLGELNIYDQYWVRASFSESLDGTTSGLWMGQKYSSDNDVKREYPELLDSEIIDAFETGKTDWFEQHVLAANLIEADLKDLGLVNDKVQILKRSDMIRVSVSKVAEIVFAGLGKDNMTDQDKAHAEYMNRLKTASFTVDLDNDGIVGDDEKNNNTKVIFASR